MKCHARTVLLDSRFRDMQLVEASYVAGAIDPLHDHSSVHFSFVLQGVALEVRGLEPVCLRSGGATVQAPLNAHTMYFPVQTRVVTIVAPKMDFTLGLAAREVRDALTDLRSAREIPHFLAYARSRWGQRMDVPGWLKRSLTSFPWQSRLPLREAAARAGVHPSHFTRVFTAHIGISPQVYRRQAKLRCAARLLLSTRATLSDIALEAGFYDQSHLTAAFSGTFKVSPAHYRRIFVQDS